MLLRYGADPAGVLPPPRATTPPTDLRAVLSGYTAAHLVVRRFVELHAAAGAVFAVLILAANSVSDWPVCWNCQEVVMVLMELVEEMVMAIGGDDDDDDVTGSPLGTVDSIAKLFRAEGKGWSANGREVLVRLLATNPQREIWCEVPAKNAELPSLSVCSWLVGCLVGSRKQGMNLHTS